MTSEINPGAMAGVRLGPSHRLLPVDDPMAPPKKKDKGMMSVYPSWEVAAALGGYKSNPFTRALRIAAQVVGDAAVEVADRFPPEEWEVLRVVVGARQWEPELPNPGNGLAESVERAHQRMNLAQHLGLGKSTPDVAKTDKAVQNLARKLRDLSYLESWAVIIAVMWRLERDDVKPGDRWWTITYRAEKIEAEKPAKE